MAWVSRPVEPFVVLNGDGAKRRERGRGCQHPLSEIDVQTCPFLFGWSKRAPFVPDGVRHPELAEVVYEGCSSQRRGIDGPEPVERTGSRHEVGNRARVTEGER